MKLLLSRILIALLMLTLLYEPPALAANWLRALWGHTPSTALALGLWSYHLKSKTRATANWQNNMVGLRYKTLFVGTFQNSFNHRSYTVGIDRELWKKNLHLFRFSLGYRFGVVHGYGKRFAKWADDTPVIPFLEPYFEIFVGRVGIDIAYAGVVFTAGFMLRLSA